MLLFQSKPKPQTKPLALPFHSAGLSGDGSQHGYRKQPDTTMTQKQKFCSVRSYHFAQLVSDYFMVNGFYPSMREMRILHLYATRKTIV